MTTETTTFDIADFLSERRFVNLLGRATADEVAATIAANRAGVAIEVSIAVEALLSDSTDKYPTFGTGIRRAAVVTGWVTEGIGHPAAGPVASRLVAAATCLAEDAGLGWGEAADAAVSAYLASGD